MASVITGANMFYQKVRREHTILNIPRLNDELLSRREGGGRTNDTAYPQKCRMLDIWNWSVVPNSGGQSLAAVIPNRTDVVASTP
jgi:hypothetical protein